MEKNNKIKNVLLGILLVAVLTLSIAFAALSATLTINAQATVKNGTAWSVKFQEKSGQSAICVASSNASVKTQPTITSTSFSGLVAEFKAPGDKVVCTWEVTNAGSIDAKIATFTKGTPTSSDASVTSKINYSLTYNTESGTAVAKDDTLPATTGNTKTLVLTIGYDSSATYIPSTDVVVSGFDTTIIYEQD